MDKKKLNDLDYALSVCLKYIMIILVIVALIYILIGCSDKRVVTEDELTDIKWNKLKVELLDEYNNPTDTILCYDYYYSTSGGNSITLIDKNENIICRLLNVKIKLTNLDEK